MADNKLTPAFLEELFKACLRSQTILDVTLNHLKYDFLPTQEHKRILKELNRQYQSSGEKPTFGAISQELSGNDKCQDVLDEVKKCELRSSEYLFSQLEEYIKRSMFVDLYRQMGDFYNKDKHDKAREILRQKSEEIFVFSIRQKNFEPVFANFFSRHGQRKKDSFANKTHTSKSSLGIDMIDSGTGGGVDSGDTFLIIARSGIGKTKALRHIGVHNARLGKRVLHIQLEGSKKECEDGYDAAIAGTSMGNIELGDISENNIEKLRRSFGNIRGEIYIYAFEQFGKADMGQIRQIAIDAEKMYGKIDMILLDYIDKAQPSGNRYFATGQDGEKARKQALGEDFKNLCLELNMSGGTATQASDIPPQLWNDPNYIITRSDIKGDKNFVDPFSYVFSFNQTTDEYKANIMRLFEDKIRKYKAGKIHTIVQNYDSERFYDAIKTRQYNLTHKPSKTPQKNESKSKTTKRKSAST